MMGGLAGLGAGGAVTAAVASGAGGDSDGGSTAAIGAVLMIPVAGVAGYFIGRSMDKPAPSDARLRALNPSKRHPTIHNRGAPPIVHEAAIADAAPNAPAVGTHHHANARPAIATAAVYARTQRG